MLCGTSFFHEISDFCHFFLLRSISQVYLHTGYFNTFVNIPCLLLMGQCVLPLLLPPPPLQRSCFRVIRDCCISVRRTASYSKESDEASLTSFVFRSLSLDACADGIFTQPHALAIRLALGGTQSLSQL